MGCEALAEPRYAFDLLGFSGLDGARLFLVLGSQDFDPLARDGGIGQVGLVEQDQNRSFLPEFRKHGVSTRSWEPSIEHLDHHIGATERLGEFSPGFIHMAGKPVDRHF